MARYLKQFLAVFAAAMVLVAAVNLTVDPNGLFRHSAVKGFNDRKTLKGDGGRVLKSLILSRHSFEVVFFGSSQGEVGLDPASPVLDGARAFNASLSYTNMHELAQAMAFTARHQRPELVVVSLDFVSFSGSEVTGGDFTQSGFAEASLWPAWARRVFSAQSLKDSFGVLRKSRRGQPQFFVGDGRADPAVRGAFEVNREFRSLVATYLTSEPDSLAPPRRRQNTFRSFIYTPERVRLLQEAVERFERGGAQVMLFVPPVHAWYLEALIDSGLLPAYEQWKRDLVASVAEVNARAARPVRLWDFSGYSAVTTDPVPEGRAAGSRWYWDPAHYKKEAGDLVLARMLGRGAAAGDFGVELTPATIDGVLADIRRGHARYRETGGDASMIAEQVRASRN